MIKNLIKPLFKSSFICLISLGTNIAVAAEKVIFPKHNPFIYSALQSKNKNNFNTANNVAITSTNSVLLRSVTIQGNKSIDTSTLKALIADNIGQKTTATNIQKKIENYYYQEGFLLPVITVKETKNNLFEISIIEGKINNVELIVEPNDTQIANNELLQQYINYLIEMSPAKTADVQKYILLISKIPGYNVEYRLMPAKHSKDRNGIADLVLSIKRTKANLNLNVSNYGNADLGKEILLGSVKINNPFGYNESIIADIGTSNHPDALKLATVGYLKRLNSYGTSASVLGSWLIDNPYRHGTIRGPAKNDLSTAIKGQISQYLILNNNNSLRLDIGTEHRNVTNNIVEQKATKYHYDLGFIKARIKHQDFLNAVNWFVPSLLSTIDKAKQTIFVPGSYKFDPNFTLFNLAWYRDQPLFVSDFSLFSQVTWQYSKDLLPLEQQFLIGSNVVGRTYNSGLINANRGHDINFELRYTHLCNNNNKVINSLQPYTFFDISHFSNAQAITNNQTSVSNFNKTTLSGAGAGIRIFFLYELSAEMEAGINIV
jgi:hemolysin activation/secretion protein